MKSKNCGCNKPCGCGDDVLSSAPPCAQGFPECSGIPECPETYEARCAIYTGEDIVNIDIPKGTNVNDIIQKLILTIVNPGCNYPGSPCQSAIGVFFNKITQTTATLSWQPISGAVGYIVEYRLPTDINWTVNASVTGNQDTIVGLSPNTVYYVKVMTNCGEQSCSSLTFKIKTKPN